MISSITTSTTDHKQTTTYDVRNLGPGLGQAQICDGGGEGVFKPVIWILIRVTIGSPKAVHIKANDKKSA